MKTKPITPSQASKKRLSNIPDEVLSAFNELIEKNFDGDSATFGQKEIVQLATKKLKAKQQSFSYKYLDIEPIFERSGWEVNYDGPGYNEDYEATFTFTKK